ncbi:MAG TPA: hypothetical protein VGC50_15575, partial [Gammaproteobacteria bacterium]
MAVSTKITKDDKLGEKVMVACAKCGPDRAHVIAATIKEYNEDDCDGGGSFEWINRYDIIQCC